MSQLSCTACGEVEGVMMHPSHTAYHVPVATRFERVLGERENPNADVPLCSPCAEEHHTYWNGRWADYYQGSM